jgi:ubiquinol-cytochrome c reductase cytochrome b subunit
MAGDYRYQPKSAFTRWLDSRLPIWRMVDETVLNFPTPKNLNYWYTFGGILTLMLAIQIVTGIVLAMHYVPHETMAFDSTERIMRDVNYGWLMRYLHSNGASMFFVAVYIHIFRGIYYGSYKAPREVLWILGVLIYLLMMATGFLGYTLPWGQMSFWGATVITNFFSAIPFVGEAVTQWLWGSFAVDNSTLQRFFSLHYLLPFVIAGVVVLHIWALHVPGNNNPLGIDVKGPQDTVPFHPYYTVKDSFATVAFLLVLFYFVFFNPNMLGHTDNYIPANPLVTPAHIVPEWYYLPFYAILRSVPDKLAGVVLMFASIFTLFFLPWLDTSRVRSASFRPLFRQLFWVLVIDILILSYLGAQTADDSNVAIFGMELAIGKLMLTRICTLYYFVHFWVLLPLMGLIETPHPLPRSISEAVLKQSGGAAPAAASALASGKQ